MHAALSTAADQRAAESLRTIGEMVCLYVQLELSIRRFIDALAHATDATKTSVLMSRYRFQPPLHSLRVLIRARYVKEPLKLRKFRRWRNRVDKLLSRRNTIIHGSWIDGHGSLRFNRYVRCTGEHARELCGYVAAERVASDMRLLRMDIATIKAWIQALTCTGSRNTTATSNIDLALVRNA